MCRHKGQQLPLADPLVAALLLDDKGVLAPFWKRSRCDMNAVGKVTVQPDNSGSMIWLRSDGEASRKDLVAKVHNILSWVLWSGVGERAVV